jgi:uncharacterized membrane protein
MAAVAVALGVAIVAYFTRKQEHAVEIDAAEYVSTKAAMLLVFVLCPSFRVSVDAICLLSGGNPCDWGFPGTGDGLGDAVS